MGMPSAPKTFDAPWSPVMSDEERERAYDARRSQKKPWRNWYKRAAWRTLRSRRLAVEPLCRMCREEGVVTAAEVVDHVVPHRGNSVLFFSFDNTQSLCATHHNRDKQREERSAGTRTAQPARSGREIGF